MKSLVLDLRIAFRSLLQHRRRTFFLASAIAGVTALLIMLNALSTGVSETMIRAATTLSTGHVNVGGFFKYTSNAGGPIITDYQKIIEAVKQNVPEMQSLVHRGRGWAKVISDQGSTQVGVTGMDIKNEPDFRKVIQLVAGSMDGLAEPNSMLVFESQVERLKVKVGDAVTISAQTTHGTANTIDCRIVAIAKDMGLMSKWNVYVPGDTVRSLYQLRPDTSGAVQIYLKPQFVPDVTAIAARLRVQLEKAGWAVMDADPKAFWMKFQSVAREDWTGQKLDVTTWEDEVSFITWTLTVLKGLTAVLLTILIAIVVTGIMNTMWIAIRERTREIGTLRAIGMQRGGVLRMFLYESLLLGLMGSGAGALLGAGLGLAINAAQIHVPLSVQLFLMSDHIQLALHPAGLARAALFITLITTLAALYPAYRAARLKPVSAMSHFG
jgi:ABC-type lipoprotein release transport system permease subunit